jgi:phosphotransferase system HPr (HPr) family protein
MIEENLKVRCSLEPQLASLFVQNATKYKSIIKITVGTKTSNAKSIMGIMTLSILDGDEINITADGSDEQEAMKDLLRFLNRD